MSVKNKKRSGPWEMSNRFRKKSRISALFLTKTEWNFYSANNIRTLRLTEGCSIELFKNISISKGIVLTELKKVAFAL